MFTTHGTAESQSPTNTFFPFELSVSCIGYDFQTKHLKMRIFQMKNSVQNITILPLIIYCMLFSPLGLDWKVAVVSISNFLRPFLNRNPLAPPSPPPLIDFSMPPHPQPPSKSPLIPRQNQVRHSPASFSPLLLITDLILSRAACIDTETKPELVKALTSEQRDIDELPTSLVLLTLLRISPFVDFPPRSFHCFFCPFKVLQM